MNERLKQYILTLQPQLSNVEWSTEAVTQSGEELFTDTCHQSIYQSILLDTLLYYPTNLNVEFFPFEVRLNDTIVALGYLDEHSQNIIYLMSDNQVLIDLL